MSKTQAALALHDQGMNVAQAAKTAGIAAPTLHAALKRRRLQTEAGKAHCPCCGQVVREGFTVDRSVLRE